MFPARGPYLFHPTAKDLVMKADLQNAETTGRIALEFNASVRLDAEEVAALTEALRDVPGEVWLFGSRTEPSRRGGDIDILVLTDQPAFETSRTIATRFFSCCEEKIDVVVLDPAHLSPEQGDFLARIGKVRIA